MRLTGLGLALGNLEFCFSSASWFYCELLWTVRARICCHAKRDNLAPVPTWKRASYLVHILAFILTNSQSTSQINSQSWSTLLWLTVHIPHNSQAPSARAGPILTDSSWKLNPTICPQMNRQCGSGMSLLDSKTMSSRRSTLVWLWIDRNIVKTAKLILMSREACARHARLSHDTLSVSQDLLAMAWTNVFMVSHLWPPQKTG